MATQQAITLLQNADQTVILDVENPQTVPPGEDFDLTGLEVDFYLKGTASSGGPLPDSDPSTVKLSTVGGQITTTIAPNHTVKARATVTIARTVVPTAYTGFWRCDIVGVTKIPCGFGPLTVLAQ